MLTGLGTGNARLVRSSVDGSFEVSVSIALEILEAEMFLLADHSF